MITHAMPSERLSKKMELVLYLARKSTKMATYDELLDRACVSYHLP